MLNAIPQVGCPAPFSAQWQFAGPSGGFTDTSEHVIKAGVVGKQHCLAYLYIKNNNATATEITILDGTGGTVIFRTNLVANNPAEYLNFDVPIKATPGNALIIKCTTTSSASLVNAYGYSFNNPLVNNELFDSPV